MTICIFHVRKSDMHDLSSKVNFSDLADPLTEMLRGLRLDGVEYGRCRLAAPWATSFPEQEAARFHFISSGTAWLQTDSGEWLELKPGDAALLPRGNAHIIASAKNIRPVPFERF